MKTYLIIILLFCNYLVFSQEPDREVLLANGVTSYTIISTDTIGTHTAPQIVVLDTNGNPVKRFDLSLDGDTTSTWESRFDASNRVIYSRLVGEEVLVVSEYEYQEDGLVVINRRVNGEKSIIRKSVRKKGASREIHLTKTGDKTTKTIVSGIGKRKVVSQTSWTNEPKVKNTTTVYYNELKQPIKIIRSGNRGITSSSVSTIRYRPDGLITDICTKYDGELDNEDACLIFTYRQR
jgi:hypothetical protein